MIGGEGPADPTWLVADTETMVNAAKYKALVVMVEHRWGVRVYMCVCMCRLYLRSQDGTYMSV